MVGDVMRILTLSSPLSSEDRVSLMTPKGCGEASTKLLIEENSAWVGDSAASLG